MQSNRRATELGRGKPSSHPHAHGAGGAVSPRARAGDDICRCSRHCDGNNRPILTSRVTFRISQHLDSGCAACWRRQALTASEAFWTAPTRRVALAIGQPFVAAALFTLPILCLLASMKGGMVGHLQLAASLWLGFYGCGLHAAGQFISRGVRILGWGFVCAGAINLYVWQTLTLVHMGPLPLWLDPHGLMGATFGGFHLIAGIYLYFTEKGEPTP